MRKFFAKHPRLRRIAFFFPIQLFLVVVKKNQMMILLWALFFGFVTQNVAKSYGIPYLFLNPEYLGEVNFWSYLILGFACGGFIMAFNMSSYIQNGFRFPFLATLSNPFLKYCINNFIFPLSFLLVYSISIFLFQINVQYESVLNALFHILGFLTGNILFFIMSSIYFKMVNKDIQKMFGVELQEGGLMRSSKRAAAVNLVKKKSERDWYVETYLNNFFQPRLARKYGHYKKEMLIKVFKQNHLTAAVFELIAIVSLFALGFLKTIPAFKIPAGASIFLLFTMFLMLAGALHTWLRGWSTTASIAILLVVNHFYQFNFFDASNKAYGLNYNNQKPIYTTEVINKQFTDEDLKNDFNNTITILNNWRIKNAKNSIEKKEKPKLILLNTSGGGIRSMLWTFHVLQYTDSVLKGELLKHISLITGSSGGMLGAAYMRELMLLKEQKRINSIYNKAYIDNACKDLLNPIAFSIATSDLFFRFEKFSDGKYRYPRDRAFAFETQLNENTNYVFNKRLKDYLIPEQKAIIPMMIFSPCIVNDGRKLIITPQPVSYLISNAQTENIRETKLTDNIEFSRYFKNQEAENLQFTSALRMNATFPYVMPIVSLPSEPTMEIIDAGMRDNYGIETSLRFMYTFRNWIASNTSGVIIIQTRDRYKDSPVDELPPKSIMQSFSRPIGSVYGNLFSIQDYNHFQLMQYACGWFDAPIDVIDFQLRNEKKDKISLSWHLTNKEKKKVLESIDLPENQDAIKRLQKLLE